MARKKIPASTQDNVLIRSRRRCCVCFGLDRDTKLKSGQIAHLDHNNLNDSEENLAFLCFHHHDEYDSKTSQRKGFTIGELKAFQSELYVAVGKSFTIDGHFGFITVPPRDPYAGNYVRVGPSDSAVMTLTPMPDNIEGYPRYAVSGSALWGMDREFGPNMGELEFIGVVESGKIFHQFDHSFMDDPQHSIHIELSDDTMFVTEENFVGIYGMNVTFGGEYRRAT